MFGRILDSFSRLVAWLQDKKGPRFLRLEQRDGWSAPLPIYIVNCPKHGWFEDYPAGFNQIFVCPKCMAERRREKWLYP